jgi:NTE family protein
VSGKSSVVVASLLALVLSVWAQQPARESVLVEPPVRIGLALSGGAALGLAHIGVLKVLERESIPVVAISGTSMGSLVGGLYAAGYSAVEIESLALSADWLQLLSPSLPFGAQYLPERQQAQRYVLQLQHKNLIPFLPGGLLPLQNVEFLLMRLLAGIEYKTGYDFDSLPIPFRAVAVDLESGELQVMRRGRLEQAIRASIAGPGTFAPEKLDGRELVDGGVLRTLPVDILDSIAPGVDLRIGVLTARREVETGPSLIDIASRSIDIATASELKRQEQLADVLIKPNVDPFAHSGFVRAAGLIAAGESAAEASLPRIRELIGERRAARHARPVGKRRLPIVRSIRFEGLHVTREGTVRKEVMTRPGDSLRFSRLIDDLVRLFNTGLFEDVNYRLDELRGDSADVIIEVQERTYGFYSLGIRYDNSDNLVLGLEVGQGNLGGSGASVRAAFDLGKPYEARLGLTGTSLFQLPFGYRLDGFWGSINRPYYELSRSQGSYKVSYRGGVGEAGYILGPYAFFDVGLSGYRAAYGVPAGFPTDSVRADQPEWIVGPTFRLEVNTSRDIYFPTAGVVSKLEVLSSLAAMKATHQFVKLGYSVERVLPLSSLLLLRPSLDLGFSLGELSWAEQFRTGGAGFVGFASDEFTSAQRAVARFGADLRLFRFFGQENYPVYLQVMGNVGTFKPWGDLLTMSGLPSLLHWGAGAGARTNTPIGPVQLILGVGDFGGKLREQRTTLAFFVSVGREFRYTR